MSYHSTLFISTTLFSHMALAHHHRNGGYGNGGYGNGDHRAPSRSSVPLVASKHGNYGASALSPTPAAVSAYGGLAVTPIPVASISLPSGTVTIPVKATTTQAGQTFLTATRAASISVHYESSEHWSIHIAASSSQSAEWAFSSDSAAITWPSGWVSPVLTTVSGTVGFATTGNGDSPAPFPTALASFAEVPASLIVPSNSENCTSSTAAPSEVPIGTLPNPYGSSGGSNTADAKETAPGTLTAISPPNVGTFTGTYIVVTPTLSTGVSASITSEPAYVTPSAVTTPVPELGFDGELLSSTYPTADATSAAAAESTTGAAYIIPATYPSGPVIPIDATSAPIADSVSASAYGAPAASPSVPSMPVGAAYKAAKVTTARRVVKRNAVVPGDNSAVGASALADKSSAANAAAGIDSPSAATSVDTSYTPSDESTSAGSAELSSAGSGGALPAADSSLSSTDLTTPALDSSSSSSAAGAVAPALVPAPALGSNYDASTAGTNSALFQGLPSTLLTQIVAPTAAAEYVPATPDTALTAPAVAAEAAGTSATAGTGAAAASGSSKGGKTGAIVADIGKLVGDIVSGVQAVKGAAKSKSGKGGKMGIM